MKNKNKRGITVSSLVLYVVLFFGITTFISIMYTNMSDTMFNNRGMALNYTALNKLEYNLTSSSLNSTDVVIENDTIKFSNGDKYYYDDEKDMVILNSGILCTSISECVTSIVNVGDIKKIQIEVIFNKYLTELKRTIILGVGA